MNVYKTLWGAVGSGAPFPTFEAALPMIAQQGWDGVSVAEIAVRFEPEIGNLADLGRMCDDLGLGMSVMIHTFGDDVAEHRTDLQRGIEAAAALGPHHIICHGGVDAWNDDQAAEFYETALTLERVSGVPIAHETHRGRLLHTPWQARRLIEAHPDLRLAVDLSHWVVVAERLIDDQLDVIDMAAGRTIHVDARVGHEQAPQVPDPRDDVWRDHLSTFESWWDRVIGPDTVVVPEYGPFPYLPATPFDGRPVADLWDVCDWARQRVMTRFREAGGEQPGT